MLDLRHDKGPGIEPGGSTPEELGAIIRADIVKWARVIKLAKVKP
jgi:tripartite-type tricarboxylate transporter receptor subunit TctC